MSYNPGLVGIDNSQDSTLSNILLDNFVQFYDWGFLDKGGYVNINSPSSGMYGGTKNLLKAVDDPNYRPYQSWQAYRQNWVWETGVNRNTQPIPISGIYKNNTFLPFAYSSSLGYYAGSGYRIDYPNGRVIFDTPIPATSTVSINYSYKWLSVQRAEGLPFFRQIQQAGRVDQNFFTASGDWVQLGQNRVQMPAIFIEVPKKITYQPYQLGGGQLANADMVIYVITDKLSTCTNILDAISYQNDRDIKLFDSNSVYRDGDLSINYRGDLTNKTNSYPALLNNHFFANCRINDTVVNDPTMLSYSLYMGSVRFSTKVEMSSLS